MTISTEDFKNNQVLADKLAKISLINLVTTISLKLLNKYQTVDIEDIVNTTTAKLLKRGK